MANGGRATPASTRSLLGLEGTVLVSVLLLQDVRCRQRAIKAERESVLACLEIGLRLRHCVTTPLNLCPLWLVGTLGRPNGVSGLSVRDECTNTSMVWISLALDKRQLFS